MNILFNIILFEFQCLTWIFTTELVIKLVGLLPTEFWKTKWNIFDTIIVVVSLVELNVGSSNSSFNVSGLRSLRVVSSLNYSDLKIFCSFLLFKVKVSLKTRL